MVLKKKQKLLVTPYNTKKEKDKEAAKIGKEILLGYKGNPILVKYKGKKWCMLELLQYLARKVYQLERNQCKPSTKCLFEGQEYMERKYIGKK